MTTNLFLEAFGWLAPAPPHRAVIVAAEEDLYSVFRERAELMGWSTMDSTHRPLFWDMHEAELTAGHDSGRIGWVQVGLASSVIGVGPVHPTRMPGWTAWPEVQRNNVEPAQVLPALCQCLEDALCRFGDVTLTGLQLTISYLAPRIQSWVPEIPGHNWFHLTPQEHAAAVLAFDHAWVGGLKTHELVTHLQGRNTGSCAFGPMVTVPESCRIRVPVEAPSTLPTLEPAGCGMNIRLPEWTASAVGWGLAFIIDTARALAPDVRHGTVRVTRLQQRST